MTDAEQAHADNLQAHADSVATLAAINAQNTVMGNLLVAQQQSQSLLQKILDAPDPAPAPTTTTGLSPEFVLQLLTLFLDKPKVA